MHVITFYSFKGGVGRTMALVNVAAQLVKWGSRVLVVDFDLEAPGLETYKSLRPKKPHLGIVEYVTEFDKTFKVPNIHDYVYETEPIGKRGGKLFVMPAGRRDTAYRRALVGLNWKRFYQEREGFLFFEETREAWRQEYKPDYVLVDSRTGDTDVLGICTRQLPDSVVLLFVPNEQNLAGLENVCKDIRREETEGLKKKIKLHFVAANVPDLDDEYQILERQLKDARDRLKYKELSGTIYRYESLALLDQSVFVLDRPGSKLARAYESLAETLVKDNLTDKMGAKLNLEEYVKNPGPLWNSSILDPNLLKTTTGPFREDVEVFNLIEKCRVLDKISKLSPNRLEDAIDLLVTLGDGETSVRGDESLTARLLRKMVASMDAEDRRMIREGWVDGYTYDPDFLHALVRAKCWSELFELHGEQSGNYRTAIPFYLGITIWGLTGELPESLCQPALEEFPDDLEKTVWLHWRLGNLSVALKELEELERKAKQADEGPVTLLRKTPASPWSFEHVSLDQFLADCQLVRRVFQGEPLRPAFLGPLPAAE